MAMRFQCFISGRSTKQPLLLPLPLPLPPTWPGRLRRLWRRHRPGFGARPGAVSGRTRGHARKVAGGFGERNGARSVEDLAVEQSRPPTIGRRDEGGDDHIGARAILDEGAPVLDERDGASIAEPGGAAETIASGLAVEAWIIGPAAVAVGPEPLFEHEVGGLADNKEAPLPAPDGGATRTPVDIEIGAAGRECDHEAECDRNDGEPAQHGRPHRRPDDGGAEEDERGGGERRHHHC